MKKTKTTKSVNIMDRVKSFEDACKIEKIDAKKLPDVSMVPEKYRKSITAFYKLSVIHSALNEGWVADPSNHNQNRYSNWFVVEQDNKHPSGFGFSGTDYHCWGATTSAAARLLLRSSALALYSGNQFADLHLDYFAG